MDRSNALREAAAKGIALLTDEEEQKLLAPISTHVQEIQQEIDALRADGTDRVTALTNHIASVRGNAYYTAAEKSRLIAADNAELKKAKAVEKANSPRVKSLVREMIALWAAKDWFTSRTLMQSTSWSGSRI